MANWDRQFSNGSYYNHWYGRLVYNLDSQNVGANSSHISLYLQIFADAGYSQNGLWDGRIYVGGGLAARATPTVNAGSGLWQITSWGGDIGHDANGNCTINIGDYINAPVNEMVIDSINWGLPRLALAPSINSYGADTIKPTTARLYTEINNYGHGTSAACRFYYRIQGTSTWSQTEDQGDAAGNNYFALSGLKPGKTYEYFVRWWNNNGDTVDGSVATFKTKGIPGMAPVLMALA